MITFGLRGRDTIEQTPPEDPDMPTLIPSREGENCDASIFGNVLELKPRVYTSAGVTYWWHWGAGFRNLTPGESYEIRVPLADSAYSIRYARQFHSHDSRLPNDWAKQWEQSGGGGRTDFYKYWIITAQSQTLDVSATLPAPESMVTHRLTGAWAPYVDSSPAQIGPFHEVARTPQAVDQHGLVIPEQIQRLWRMGSGSVRVFLCTNLHAGEHVGTRVFINAIDVLIDEFPSLLERCTFVCTPSINPGRYYSHNRGYGVGAGSDDPNRQWGQYNPTTPFVSSIEDALKADRGGVIQFDAAFDLHGRHLGGPQLWYPPASRGLEFHQYVDAYDSGALSSREVNLSNSTQNAASEQWGAAFGSTMEISGVTTAYTDSDLRRFARAMLGGLELAIADDYFLGVSQSPGPNIILDNRDAGVQRVGSWSESGADNEYQGSSEYCGGGPDNGCAGYLEWPVNVIGSHRVEVWYTWHRNRSQNVRYVVTDANGEAVYPIDQSSQINAARWLPLGVHLFDGTGSVRVLCDQGQASADAIRLIPTEGLPEPSSTIAEDVDDLQSLAQILLAETGSSVAQDLVDGLAALRQRVEGM